MHLREYFSDERMFDRRAGRDDPALWSSASESGMVATASYHATRAGVEALRRGGNAVDAAAAASFALGVAEPAGSGLGGMGILVLYLAEGGRTVVLEGACRAPRAASPDVVAGGARYRGYRTVAIPSLVALLEHALQRYGKRSCAEAIDPAAELAERGVPLTAFQHAVITRYRQTLHGRSVASLFLDEECRVHEQGWVLRQPALGRTLRRLQRAGLTDFYRGAIAARMCEDMRDNGGFVAEEDLVRKDLVREVAPLEGRLAASTLHVPGPPAGGLILLRLAHLVDALGPQGLDLREPRDVVLLAAAIRRSRRDRRDYRLRTGADAPGEAAELLDRSNAERSAERILAELDARGPVGGDGETTHVSVADRWGNVLALTQSIERSFGAAVATPDLGFLYNGYLRAFKVRNRLHPHYLQPGVPARSNAAPTIALRGGRPWAALGNTGSERMHSGILGVLLRLEREGPFAAVHAPRMHCTPEGHVLWEAQRFVPGCRAELERHGFTVEDLGPYSFQTGGLQLVARPGAETVGVADPRRDGAAAGPDLRRGGGRG